MSDQNLFVSNGTCYTAPGEKLDGSFIPCGNDAFGHQTCCGAGDNCLADNACFGFHGSGYGSYLTYMAGCSDPEYKDSTCPKKDVDQPWIALTLCDNSNGEWAACSQLGNPTTLRPGSYCSCTDAASATVQFSDTTSLASICSLPQSTGGSIQFFAGHTPTSSPPSGTTIPASSPGSTSGSATPTQTKSPTSSLSGAGGGNSGTGGGNSGTGGGNSGTGGGNSGTGGGNSGTGAGNSGSAKSTQTGSITSSLSGTAAANSGTPSASQTGTTPSNTGTGSGLSSGAIAGIGAGAAVGGLILLAAIAAFFILRRRRRRSPSEIESGSVNGNGNGNGKKLSKRYSSDHQRVSAMSTATKVSEADGQAMAEADGRAARPWNLRSELEGSQVAPNLAEYVEGEGWVRRSGESGPVVELPGSESWQAPGVDLHAEGRHVQGVGQIPAHYGPRKGPRHSPVGTTSQAPTHGRGLSVVGPEGAHFPGEQGAPNTPTQD